MGALHVTVEHRRLGR